MTDRESSTTNRSKPAGWLEKAENFLATLAGVILVLIVASVCLEIVMRYFLRQPLVWVVEFTEYGLLYITFLGAPWLLRQEGHVKVDVIILHLGRRWWNILGIFSSTLGLAVCLVLTVFGTITTHDHFVRDVYNVTIIQFPTWIVLLCIPIGSLFLTIRFFRRAFGFLVNLRSDGSNTYGGGVS